MEVGVLNINGQETERKITLNEAIFGIEPSDHVLHLDIKQYSINQCQGTARLKERGELSGSTRKLDRQRSGGGVHRGDINSPLSVDGTRAFGPKPYDYHFKLNKKVKNFARRSASSYEVQENAIAIVEDPTLDASKARGFVNITKNLKVEGKRSLLVLPEADESVCLSARNLQQVDMMTASTLNIYRVLNVDVLVVTESSLKVIGNILIR